LKRKDCQLGKTSLERSRGMRERKRDRDVVEVKVGAKVEACFQRVSVVFFVGFLL